MPGFLGGRSGWKRALNGLGGGESAKEHKQKHAGDDSGWGSGHLFLPNMNDCEYQGNEINRGVNDAV